MPPPRPKAHRAEEVGGEIMMPVTQPDAMMQAEILVLRQIGESIASVARGLDRVDEKLEKQGEKLDDIQGRVIRLEEQKTQAAVATVQAKLDTALNRIDTLEKQRHREEGATSVWVWLSKNIMWIFGAAVTFVAGLAIKTGIN